MIEYNAVEVNDKFNKLIKDLIKIITDTIGKNVLLESAKQKISFILNADPFFLLENAGLYIYKYREIIKNGDFEDLIMNTENYILSDDKSVLEDHTSKASSEEKSGFESIIISLRNSWSEYGKKEKKIIKKIITGLLSEYCKYQIIQQN